MSRNKVKLSKTEARDSRLKFPSSFSAENTFDKTGGTLTGTLVVQAPIVFTTAFIRAGNGIPEGSITANVASIWIREDGSGTSTLYVKKTGSGNTGWVEIT